MERQRNLIMQDPTIKCPPEYDEHPVFITNQQMNEVITRRRSKVYKAHLVIFCNYCNPANFDCNVSLKQRTSATRSVCCAKAPSGRRSV